jgi:hypothetical protein
MDIDFNVRASWNKDEKLRIINNSIIPTPIIATRQWNIERLITSIHETYIWSVCAIWGG